MAANLTIALILLTFVIGLWVGSKFSKSAVIKFFARNDWFVGLFLVLIGYANFVSYPTSMVRNLSLVLIIIGLLIILIVLVNLSRK